MRAIPVVLIAALLAGCGAKQSPSLQMSEQFVYDMLALSPTYATSVGYHQHRGMRLDSMLDDMSISGLDAQRRFFNDYRRRFDEASRQADVSPEDRADIELIRNQIELSLLELDTIQNWKHNPTTYVELIGNALYSPYVLEYAPKTRRFRDIVARIQKVPTVLEQARANLADSPEVWNRVAQEENEGNIALIDITLRRDCPAESKAVFDRAAAGALAALRDFNNWLRTDLSKSTSDWRLGKDKYALKLKYALGTDQSPEQLLADAEATLKSTRDKMAEIAKGETVEAALNRIAGKHASPDTYFDAAKRDLAEATAFVRDHKLLTLPARTNLQVIPTPEFMRGIYGVGGFSSAPALEPRLGAFYWITPIPPKWPAERIESKLREYNFYGLKILTVHEAMPGHYVQAEYANDIQPEARKLVRSVFGNTPYVEGWAVYATDTMIDSGYYKDDPGMQLTWDKQFLRVVANTILDIRMQTMGMTDQEALDLMIKDTYQEREEATAKLQRAQLSSAQLPTYFAGYRGWVTDRDQYRGRKGSSYSMQDFHERALKEGAVSLPSLGRLLGGE
jgi:uncharacterized protein (DUF885 family)